MSIKSEKLFLKPQFHAEKSKQFLNLNLNQNNKCLNVCVSLTFQSYSKSNSDKNYCHTVADNNKEKSWNKSTKNLSLKTLKNPSFENESQKCWMKTNEKDISNPIKSSSSTLSLHISAYENSINAASDDLENLANKSAKFVTSHLQDIQDFIEFPRQMENNKFNAPQIQQFKASQKLFSPNQSTSSFNNMHLDSQQKSIKMASTSNLPASSSLTVDSENLLDFVAAFSSTPQSYFQRKSITDPKLREKLNLFRLRLNQLLTKLKQEKCDSPIFPLHQRRYKDITYKHGLSQRHQKFWKATQQLIKQQKKINGSNFLEGFNKISEGLTKSSSSFEYTKDGISFAGVQLIQRIIQLDKLRILCIRAIDLYMGYIELGHFLIFLLMLVAMAAELSTEANRQIVILHGIYDSLGEVLHSVDERFPLNSKDIPYESKQIKSKETSKEVEFILKLTNSPVWEEAKIVQKYREEMGLENVSDGGDHVQEMDEEIQQQMNEATTMTQQLLSLSRKRKSETHESQNIFGRKKTAQKKFKNTQKR